MTRSTSISVLRRARHHRDRDSRHVGDGYLAAPAAGDCRPSAGAMAIDWSLGGRLSPWCLRASIDHDGRQRPRRSRSRLGIPAVGIAWAALYVVIMKLGFGSDPTFISALAVSLALLVAPWFVMQPALGFGFMAARLPKPAAVRAVNVSAHTVFGVGLYLGAIGWAWIVGVP